MLQKTKGLTSHQTLYHFCALFVRTEYHHQSYPSVPPPMAQASTLVPVTKMKKAQAWTLAISEVKDYPHLSIRNKFNYKVLYLA